MIQKGVLCRAYREKSQFLREEDLSRADRISSCGIGLNLVYPCAYKQKQEILEILEIPQGVENKKEILTTI